MSQLFSWGVPGHSVSQVFRSPMHHAPVAQLALARLQHQSPKYRNPARKENQE